MKETEYLIGNFCVMKIIFVLEMIVIWYIFHYLTNM